MASNKSVAPTTTAAALLLSLNLLFFSATATNILPATCPIDYTGLGVCADLLGLVSVVVGSTETLQCCNHFSGLTNLQVAACLCAAADANILGISLNIEAQLTLLAGYCGHSWPSNGVCS